MPCVRTVVYSDEPYTINKRAVLMGFVQVNKSSSVDKQFFLEVGLGRGRDGSCVPIKSRTRLPHTLATWYSLIAMAPSTARKLSSEVDDDPTFYPSVEKLGDDWVQALVVEAFRPLLECYVADAGIHGVVGADQLMYYVQGDPTACVSPDAYVLPGVSPPDDGERLGSWKKWQISSVPSFALEVMSENNKKKDNRQSPLRHDALGTKELIVLDPYADERFKLRGRTRFRIYRRDPSGRLVLVHSTNERQIQSETLGCHLRVVGVGNSQRLRIVTGPNGETLFPTRAEAEAQRTRDALQRVDDEARRADAEAKRADEARQRVDEEARRADAEAKRASNAEAEIARLRAELDAMKRRG